MKIAIEILRDMLKQLKPITRGHLFPPLKRIKFNYDHPHYLEIIATDGDHWLTTYSWERHADEPFAFVVDLLELENMLATKERFITLTPDVDAPGQILVTTSDPGWSATLPAYPVDEFPPVPERQTTWNLFTLYEDDWKAVLRAIVPSVATDESRPVLNCVHFDHRDGQVIATGADGFRLTTHRMLSDIPEFKPFLLPLPGVKRLPKKLKNLTFHRMGDDDSYLYLEYTNQRTKTSPRISCSMVVRLAEGTFPDYEQIIPTEDVMIGRCGIPFWIIEAAAKVKHGTVINFANGKAELGVHESTPRSWASVGITLTPNEGKEFTYCSFNPQYLYDLALAMNWQGTIHFQRAHNNAYLVDNGQTRSVLMAMVIPQNPFTRKEREAAIAAQMEAAVA